MLPVRPISVMSNRTVGVGNWGAFIADISPYGLAVEHRRATSLTGFADKQRQTRQLNWPRGAGDGDAAKPETSRAVKVRQSTLCNPLCLQCTGLCCGRGVWN